MTDTEPQGDQSTDTENGPENGSQGDVQAVLSQRQVSLERQANRIGPIHPAHWQHAQWLADRGLDESYDKGKTYGFED